MCSQWVLAHVVIFVSLFALPSLLSDAAVAGTSRNDERVVIGHLHDGMVAAAVRDESNRWGIAVGSARGPCWSQSMPAMFELFRDGTIQDFACGYRSVNKIERGIRGRAVQPLDGNARLVVEDLWTVAGLVLQLKRKVTVSGNAAGGFLSSITLHGPTGLAWPDVRWFAPGMIYGGFDHLSPAAIGGRGAYQRGHYDVRIREDRLPIPVFACLLRDGTSAAVLRVRPDGRTTKQDSRDVNAVTMIDRYFQFGAIGGVEHADGLAIGYWFPGTEGQVTYRGNTYPGGQIQKYRRRYHPLEDGLAQRYEVRFRFSNASGFPDFFKDVWRWAWRQMAPRVAALDLDAARRCITDLLASQVVEHGGLVGIPNFIDAASKENPLTDDKAVLGFCGKNLEAADFLLREADRDGGPRGQRMRRVAEQIISSFLKLQVAPPVGEGFGLRDGKPRCAIGDRQVFLRSFGDGMKALMRAYLRERHQGRAHPKWLAWTRRFADWLLDQEQPEGGFPRAWAVRTGAVVAPSPTSSYNAVPMLVMLARATGDRKYLDAATRAMDYCWSHGQRDGQFIGGTIDNPDVLDKEAGTLSLEAYLALHKATGADKWLVRAQAAANFAETWIYCWNVPMPDDELDADLPWKHGVPTVGLQLISTGHSLVDAYMAFDADEFARLWQLTKDPHYLGVARILLYDTKSMLALPGRTYDLRGPGWQQEHWSLAPQRGFGLHRGWLPWVATSQLNGIFGVLQLSPEVRKQVLIQGAKP